MASPHELGLYPYLLPEYWNGHSIGIGDVAPPPYVRTDAKSRRVARGALEHYNSGASTIALQTFRHGDEFAAEAHPPGTIVCIENEQLLTNLPLVVDVAELREDGVTAPETTPPMRLDELYVASNGVVHYLAQGCLGITAQTRKGAPVLLRRVSIPRFGYTAHGHLGMAVTRGYRSSPPGFTAGQVDHYARGNGEVVTRDRAVHILQQGEPARKPFWAGWLPHGRTEPA